MKKMKLFPKTFLYTFFMLLFITTSMHLMIYFFYPKVYLSRMQDQLEKKMDTLQQEIKRNTAAEAGQIFSDFVSSGNWPVRQATTNSRPSHSIQPRIPSTATA